MLLPGLTSVGQNYMCGASGSVYRMLRQAKHAVLVAPCSQERYWKVRKPVRSSPPVQRENSITCVCHATKLRHKGSIQSTVGFPSSVPPCRKARKSTETVKDHAFLILPEYPTRQGDPCRSCRLAGSAPEGQKRQKPEEERPVHSAHFRQQHRRCQFRFAAGFQEPARPPKTHGV